MKDQEAFTDKEKLNIALIADEEKTGAKAYGVLGKSGFASRVSIVIDKKGIVRKVYDVKDVMAHPEEVLKFVKDELEKK